MARDTEFWEELLSIYDLYRTVRLNEIYYSNRLKTNRLWTNVAQLATVGFALASGHLLIAKDELGPLPFTAVYVLTVLGVVLCQIIRTRTAEIRYARLRFVYRTMFLDMQELVQQIRLKQRIDPTIREMIAASKRRMRDVGSDEDLVVRKRLRHRLTEEVANEISSFWMPEEWYKHQEERSDADESGSPRATD